MYKDVFTLIKNGYQKKMKKRVVQNVPVSPGEKNSGLSTVTLITALLTLFVVGTGIIYAKRTEEMKTNENAEKATLGGGCFWCVEAVFQRVEGVESVQSGYAGGRVQNPSYQEVCSGNTGHAEVVQITFNPSVVSYSELLEIFFTTHDPTTPNRQGNDVGTQYRSIILYHSNDQLQVARQVIDDLNHTEVFDDPIVTEVIEYSRFYKAETYHQNYYNNNKAQPYCTFVVAPKVKKLKKSFGDKIKQQYK
jgi:peptide-methionine (S)-S-oxide reductase